MAPLITIVICAIFGLAIYGIVGLVVGAVAGWLLSMLIGTIGVMASGGLLPRKARKQAANLFFMNHQPTVDSCTGEMAEEEKRQLIESLMERIFRRATVAAPLLCKSMGMSRREVDEAAKQEAAEEQDPKVRELILLIKDHILETMY